MNPVTPDQYTISLGTAGGSLRAETSATIKEALEGSGISFPNNCNGKGKCLSCRIEFLSTPPPMTELESRLFDSGSNYRMACQHKVSGDIHILLPSESTLTSDKSILDFNIPTGRKGYGIAIDLGTTSVALYLADLATGTIISQRAFLNPQMRYGGDVISRIDFAKDNLNRNRLRDCIRDRISSEINALVTQKALNRSDVTGIVLAANSAMSQIWLGYGGDGLDRVPFKGILEDRGVMEFNPTAIGLNSNCSCQVLPVLAGFVGGDITAAILASNLDQNRNVQLMIDFGTNGEVVLSAGNEIYAASTAAGPAFEGVGMSSGMPAGQGAIAGFSDKLKPTVIGGIKPLGFCGSGYIAALAGLLRRDIIDVSGLLREDETGERRWSANPDSSLPPFINQDDVRKFQLAKGAIAAGIEIICDKAGVKFDDIDKVILTGSFGNQIDPRAAMEVGLIPEMPLDRITFIDNAAGRGAALCLTDTTRLEKAMELQNSVIVVNLGEQILFQDRFVANMAFRKLT